MAMATRPTCAVSDLIARGKESTAVLQTLLGKQATAAGEMPHGIWELTEQILRCCDRALAALQEGTEHAASGGDRKRKSDHGTGAPRSKRMRYNQ
jgi:hypothetical protein